MAIRIKKQEVKTPTTQVHIDNEQTNDKSGYFGLIMNVNKNGKAIRIADRFNNNRVHVLLSEVDNLIEGLKELKANGVKTSIKKVVYDKKAA